MTTDIDKLIKTKYGLNLDGYIENIVNKERAIIPVSPKIDLICGGGIREGSMVLLVGPPKVGKTVFALQTVCNAQKIKDGITRKTYYLNIEGRLNERDLNGIQGLEWKNPDLFRIIGSEEGKILSCEDYLLIAQDIINTTSNSIVIFDSFSMMSTRAEREYEFDGQFRMDAQKICAAWCRKNAGILGITNNIVIGILHEHANQNAAGPFAKKTVEGGGTKLQYTGDYKFNMSYFKDWNNKENNPIGQDVYLECSYSPISKPGMKSFYRLKYGLGIDEIQEILDLAKDFGVIKFAGKWVYLTDEIKLDGADNTREYLSNNPKAFQELKTKVMEYFKV